MIHHILAANLTGTMILNTIRREAVGQLFCDFVKWDDRDTLYFYSGGLFKNKRPRSCELRLQYTDNKMRQALLDGILVEDRKGRWSRRAVLIDITDLKNTQKTLRKIKDEL